MKEFNLEEREYITLCELLKAMNFCSSGGQAKLAISEGRVKVNERIELRKKCKIRAPSMVYFEGKKVKIVE